ncbi:hypothetical protein RhiirA4_450923 [Rhizophagus irregularis]|uniref:Hsp70 family protein n=1 Tax=Rhizophagus irregularis TaxID=588596 RepID=A0A2I1FUC3_9GLOM|nr:hypothetical protein RhiirA4_450923 [Rhizophagus irregularis]
MNLLEKFEKLNNKLTVLLEENKELKQQCKNLQEENEELKEKFNERDYKNLQEENKKLNQHLLNLEKQKEIISQTLEEYKRKHKNLQEENNNLNEREKHFKQHIQNLEKQKNDQLEIFSQNLEKALGKLELDILDEVNENDIKSLNENNKSLIDNYDNDSIDYIEDPFAKEAPNEGPKLAPQATMTSPPKKAPRKKSVNHLRSWGSHGEIRVVVGLDFGTTYSGFSYCHVENSRNIRTYDMWPENLGNFKTNTALQYDDSYNTVMSWGAPALAKRPNRREKNISETKPVELFKLHLGNLSENLRPKLPIDYKKAITDYLREIGKLIKEAIERSFPKIDFYESVLLILTVPTEYSEKDKAIMRECAHNAELITEKCSNKLQFTTEPEAAAIYCMNSSLQEYDLSTTETTFTIVDCGGGTIDITIRKLIGNNQLGEVTESTGDYCGGTFVDKEFINFLRKKLGDSAIDSFINYHYGPFQYMVQNFCKYAKIPFTGDQSEYRPYELDIQECAPNLLQYVNEETRFKMEENEWLVEIDYDDVKAMFDPVVNKIIRLIHLQLSNAQEECPTMILVGGFSESKYLQKRIREEFQHRVKNISVPIHPTAATLRGATLYGLSLKNSVDNFDSFHYVISSRILKYTYGIKVRNYWMEGDPIERKIRDGRIDRFHCLARRGVQVDINEEFTTFFTPLSPMQSSVSFRIYYTTEYNAKYCDEPGMKLLGKLTIYLSGSSQLDKLLFGFSFGQMEFAVTVKNETSGQYFRTKFDIDV